MAQNRDTSGFTCGGCEARWTGHRPCHCSACHQTFAGLSMFDAHRKGAPPCKTPSEVGATRLVDDIWRGPEWDPTTLQETA